jgi:Zn-dependent peptidase ImmA (M78 family)
MTEIAELASNLRKKYRLHPIPVDIYKICKQNKLTIEKYDFCDIEESTNCKIKSMIEYNREKHSGTIYVNVNDSDVAQRFYIAHELGHYFLNTSTCEKDTIFSFQGLKTTREIRANEFATELLLPKEQVIEEYDEALLPSLSFLAGVFEVPTSVMQSRLQEMGLEYIC